MGCLRCLGLTALLLAVAGPAVVYYAGRYTNMSGIVPLFTPQWFFTVEEMPDLSGKVALVTGANAGLGFSSATILAGAGAKTILACRTESKCTAAAARIRETHPNADVQTRLVDLSSLASVQAFANELASDASVEKIDMLMLNAGVMAPPYTLTADDLELQFGVNHVAHAYLTHKLLALVRRAVEVDGAATISVVSSLAHTQPISSEPKGLYLSEAALNDEDNFDRFQYYGQSKLANVLFSNELSRRLGDGAQNIFVNSVHPGAVGTDLGRHMADAVAQYVGRGASDALTNFVRSMSWTSEDAALTQVFTVASPKMVEERITGKYYHPLAKQHPASPQAMDVETQSQLWEFTRGILEKRGFTDYEAI